MAEFNKPVEGVIPPQYTGASQGQRFEGNMAGSTIGRGLASLLEGAVQGADTVIQENIRRDVEEGFDALNTEFGVDDATLIDGQSVGFGGTEFGGAGVRGQETLPADLQRAGENLERLSNARNTGALKDSHYWARLNAQVRQLRAKYPGYREQIDAIVANVTGSRPANQLRDSLMSEWGQKDGQADKWDSYIKANEKYLPADYWDRVAAGNPYSQLEVRKYVTDQKAEDYSIEKSNARMAHQNAVGELSVKEAETNYKTAVRVGVDRILTTAVEGVGGWTALQERLAGYEQRFMQTGQFLQPEEREQMEAMVRSIDMQISALAVDLSNASWEGEGGDPRNSYSSVLSEDQLKEAYAIAIRPFEMLKQALVDNNFGLFASTTRYLAAEKEAKERDLREAMPDLSYISTFMDMWGPEVGNTLLMLHPELGDKIVEQIVQFDMTQMLTRQPDGQPTKTIADAFSEKAEAQATPEYYTGMIDQFINIAGAYQQGLVPEEAMTQAAEALFGGNNIVINGGRTELPVFASMPMQDKRNFFNRMVGGTVQQAMFKIARTNPEAYGRYSEWTKTAFMGLSRVAFGDIERFNEESRDGSTIIFNPTVGLFEVVENPNAPARPWARDIPNLLNPLGGSAGPLNRAAADAHGRKAAEEMNKLIRTMTPILTFDGQNAPQALSELFIMFVNQPQTPSNS